MADAHGSGPCARKGVGVQLPPSPLFVTAPCSLTRASQEPSSPSGASLGLTRQARLGCAFAQVSLIGFCYAPLRFVLNKNFKAVLPGPVEGSRHSPAARLRATTAAPTN